MQNLVLKMQNLCPKITIRGNYFGFYRLLRIFATNMIYLLFTSLPFLADTYLQTTHQQSHTLAATVGHSNPAAVCVPLRILQPSYWTDTLYGHRLRNDELAGISLIPYIYQCHHRQDTSIQRQAFSVDCIRHTPCSMHHRWHALCLDGQPAGGRVHQQLSVSRPRPAAERTATHSDLGTHCLSRHLCHSSSSGRCHRHTAHQTLQQYGTAAVCRYGE